MKKLLKNKHKTQTFRDCLAMPCLAVPGRAAPRLRCLASPRRAVPCRDCVATPCQALPRPAMPRRALTAAPCLASPGQAAPQLPSHALTAAHGHFFFGGNLSMFSRPVLRMFDINISYIARELSSYGSAILIPRSCASREPAFTRAFHSLSKSGSQQDSHTKHHYC